MLNVVYFMSCVCSGWEVGLPAFIASSAGLQTNKRFVSLLDLLVFLGKCIKKLCFLFSGKSTKTEEIKNKGQVVLSRTFPSTSHQYIAILPIKGCHCTNKSKPSERTEHQLNMSSMASGDVFYNSLF